MTCQDVASKNDKATCWHTACSKFNPIKKRLFSFKKFLKLRNYSCNNQNTTDVPEVSTSILSEPEELQASVGEVGTITSGINLNPQQPVTTNDGIDDTSKDIHSTPMCENLTSMCNESSYEYDVKNRLNSNDEFKLVTNKRFKKSNKEKVNNNSPLTHTF
jgi:hypothetical protein